MRDLIVTSITPTLGSGTGLRTYGVTAALARHRNVDLAYIEFGGGDPAPEYAALDGVRMWPLQASRGAGRAFSYAMARMRGVPRDLARGVSPELSAEARRGKPDARVIADGPVAGAALLPLARSRKLVYLAHNLESGFRGDSGRGNLAAFERRMLRSFSEAWMATRADERGAVALAGAQTATRYVPNVVDLSLIEPVSPSGADCLLFVGDFTYAPNREALAYVVDQVLPRAWEQRPALELMVVGRGLDVVPADGRIRALGFVEDLRTAYAAADVVVVPLLHGGGSPLKFIEALGYGLPVVASAHAARLLEDGSAGEHFLAADGAEQFAGAIVRLLTDPALGLEVGRAGRELVRRSYSVDALATLLAR
jgi:glycosyltransferase involved in cell wall biosynthesis